MTTPRRRRRPGSVVLSLAGVNKRFGAVQALTDVHLRWRAGEVVALVGDNGAGKSTLVKIIAGVYQPDDGDDHLRRQAGHGPRARRRPRPSASPRCSRTWRSATTSTSSPTCSSGRSSARGPSSTRSRWRRRPGGCCARCRPRSRRSASRSPSLSGGQRQTVAIARSLVGEPKVVMLDEPTAALGVAQTAEVLNLIERLRETGLGVILISHNMADVQAVADRIVVLRLGRNAAEFNVEEATTDAARRRHHRCLRQRRDRAPAPPRHEADQATEEDAPMADTETREAAATPVAADLADERLIQTQGLARLPAQLSGNRLTVRRPRQPAGRHRAGRHLHRRSTLDERAFLSSRNLVIDHPVRGPDRHHRARHRAGAAARARSTCRSARSAASRPRSWRCWWSTRASRLLVAMLGGILIGVADRGCSTPCSTPGVGVPQLRVLAGRPARLPGRAALRAGRRTARSTCPSDSCLVEFTRFSFVTGAQSYVLVVVADRGVYVGLAAGGIAAQRKAAGLAPAWWPLVLDQGGAARGRARLPHLLPQHRPRLELPVVAVLRCSSCVMDLALRKTRWGRHVFAVGGNEEAARRSGIKVDRVYFSVFALTSTFAARRRAAGRRAPDQRSRRAAAPPTPT